MSLFQRRQPKGAPTGGQFSTTDRVETGTTLTAPTPRSWLPQVEDGVDRALGVLGDAVAPDDPEFPAPEHATAMDALHDLADALLERRGLAPRPAGDGRLVELRTAAAERLAVASWPQEKRDLLVSALGDEGLSRKADRLARMTPGRYADHAVHYLMALERARRVSGQ